jgi:hypothetical protein
MWPMSGKKAAADGGTSAPVNERRRALLKILTASAGAYTMPMVASFSMSGLRIGEAEAGTATVEFEKVHSANCEVSFFDPPGITSEKTPSGRPFGGNPPPGFTEGQKNGKPFTPTASNLSASRWVKLQPSNGVKCKVVTVPTID